jgi:uncharacterized membrane protein
MTKGRLEAFSDGVMAVIITIMVLELKAPAGSDWVSLKPLMHQLACYVLSFIFIGIYWSNHHHMMQAVDKITGSVLWANLHLLFWLSLIPLLTAWVGLNGFTSLPVALYGVDMLCSAIAYTILVRSLISCHGHNPILAKAIGNDRKGYISLAIYAFSVVIAFFEPLAACAGYVLVSIIWLVPDRRIERVLQK